MSRSRSTVLEVLGVLGVIGAALLAVPGDRHAPDAGPSEFGLCTAWASGRIDPVPVTCPVGAWTPSGGCSNGYQSEYRTISDCSNEWRTTTCTMPVCTVGAWTNWSSCTSSSACGGTGCLTQVRQNSTCGYDSQNVACTMPVCQVGSWTNGSSCVSSSACGGTGCLTQVRLNAACGYDYQNVACTAPTCTPWEWKLGCGSCGEGCKVTVRFTAACSIAYDYDRTSCPVDPNRVAANWKPYGSAVPGDSQYGFGYKDNQQQDFLALAAKGNVIVGDYTSKQFQDSVLPKLDSGNKKDSITQPYAIDPTDAELGYHTGSQGVMYDSKGRPLFDGNYTKKDDGVKLDGKDRRFYESTLSDAEFKGLIDRNDPLFRQDGQAKFDGIFFTNHAVAGLVNTGTKDVPEFNANGALNVNGALVSRDDALMFGSRLYINHDSRLRDAQTSQLGLPVSIKRPKLKSWSVCPATGCP